MFHASVGSKFGPEQTKGNLQGKNRPFLTLELRMMTGWTEHVKTCDVTRHTVCLPSPFLPELLSCLCLNALLHIFST